MDCLLQGMLEFNHGNFDQALIYYDKALVLDSGFAETWIKKSFVLDKLGRTEEAEQCRKKAKEIDPKLA